MNLDERRDPGKTAFEAAYWTELSTTQPRKWVPGPPRRGINPSWWMHDNSYSSTALQIPPGRRGNLGHQSSASVRETRDTQHTTILVSILPLGTASCLVTHVHYLITFSLYITGVRGNKKQTSCQWKLDQRAGESLNTEIFLSLGDGSKPNIWVLTPGGHCIWDVWEAPGTTLGTGQHSGAHFLMVKKQTMFLYPVICECRGPRVWIRILASNSCKFRGMRQVTRLLWASHFLIYGLRRSPPIFRVDMRIRKCSQGFHGTDPQEMIPTMWSLQSTVLLTISCAEDEVMPLLRMILQVGGGVQRASTGSFPFRAHQRTREFNASPWEEKWCMFGFTWDSPGLHCGLGVKISNFKSVFSLLKIHPFGQ